MQPSSRNLGIGSQLIQLAIDKAKAAGLPLAVAAEPQAYNFFLKQGFQETRHFDVDLKQWAPAQSGWGVVTSCQDRVSSQGSQVLVL